MWRGWSARVVLRAAVLSVVFLGLTGALLLAASPDLHHLAHHDADGENHVCLVTILDSGGFELPLVTGHTVDPLPAASAEFPVETPAWEGLILEGGNLTRGPPGAGIL